MGDSIWDAIAGFSLVAPFLTVPVFIIGTVLLQDELVNGDGRSWQRAVSIMAIPAGVLTVLAMVGAIVALARRKPPRAAAIFSIAANSLALGIILYCMITAQ